MGLVFEEDKVKGQVVVADFVEGSEAEKRNKVSIFSLRLSEQCLLYKCPLQAKITRLLRCLSCLHALTVLKHKPAVCFLVVRRHEKGKALSCSSPCPGMKRLSLTSRLGCTDAACQLFRGVLQVCSTECDVLASGVMYSSARCCVEAALLLWLWSQNRSWFEAWQSEQLSIIHHMSQRCMLECTAIQLGRYVRHVGPSQVAAVCT